MDSYEYQLKLVKLNIDEGKYVVAKVLLNKLSKDSENILLKSLSNDVQDENWRSASLKIAQFLNAEGNAVVLYEDPEFRVLKKVLEGLEEEIQISEVQYNEMNLLIGQYQYRYQVELGNLVEQILNLKLLIAKHIKDYKHQTVEAAEKVFLDESERLMQIELDIDKAQEELDRLNPESSEYESILRELEHLKTDLYFQQVKFKEAKNYFDNLENEFTESTENKDFESAKKTSDDYKKSREEVLSEEKIDLKGDEKKRIRKLFRKAIQMCHPDKVSKEFELQAKSLTSQLYDARSRNDIGKVEEIYDSLLNGLAFDLAIDSITEISDLKLRIKNLESKLHKIKLGISDLEQTASWKEIPNIDSWDQHFKKLEQALNDELLRLKGLLSTDFKTPDESVNSTCKPKDNEALDDEFWTETF